MSDCAGEDPDARQCDAASDKIGDDGIDVSD